MEEIRPADEIELGEAVAQAARERIGLRILGGGTKAHLGNPIEAERMQCVKALNVSALSGVVLYEPEALTLVARAGTPLREIENLLGERGQHLAFEPPDYRGLPGDGEPSGSGEATLGGTVACAASGPRLVRVGGVRDFLLGVRFVNGEGKAIRSGGRVMKNVTGYDLAKPMAGAFGTLGVLSEIALKVLPRPEARAVLLIEGLSDEKAIAAMSSALSSPFEVSGAAHTPCGVDGDPVTMLRLEGLSADSLLSRAEKLRALLSDFGRAEIETRPEATAAGWKWVREVETFREREGAIWKMVCKPSESAKAIASVAQSREVEALYDWGGGMAWILTPESERAGEEIIRSAAEKAGGYATLMRASDGLRKEVSAFHPQPAGVEAISAKLRKQFDPAGILNPGLMGDSTRSADSPSPADSSALSRSAR